MSMDLLTLIALLILAPLLWQTIARYAARAQQARLIAEFERARKSKVIPLIHVKPRNMLFGFVKPEMIDLESVEPVLDKLRRVPPETPVDLVLHTPGGYMIASLQIAEAIAAHKGPVTAFVPYHALSGGTLVALAADQIVMSEHAVLGRIDPQLLYMPAHSLKKVLDVKGERDSTDVAIALGDLAQKAIRQARDAIFRLLIEKGYSEPAAETITGELVSDMYTHDSPVFFRDAKKWGLRVSTEIPNATYSIVQSSERAQL